MQKNKNRIGFISTRFAGTDGVSLEAEKWAQILRSMGHDVYWFAGELDRDPVRSYHIEEAHFKHKDIKQVHDEAFGLKPRQSDLEDRIRALEKGLQKSLCDFASKYNISLFVVENASALPMNVPLGFAIKNYLQASGMPAILHHHDFFWERERFRHYRLGQEYDLFRAFPPDLANVRHVVINSQQHADLTRLKLKGNVYVLPNVMDFENGPVVDEYRAQSLLKRIGIENNMVLQPTRIIQRKHIEKSVDFVHELQKQTGVKRTLYIPHEAGDEGTDYLEKIRAYAREKGVRLVTSQKPLPAPWYKCDEKEPDIFDSYSRAELVTYPSDNEGFGNAFLEAVFHKKPLVMNPYPVYSRDIAKYGFWTITLDRDMKSAVGEALAVMTDPKKREELVEHNYTVAQEHFSYKHARQTLGPLLN